MFTGIVEQIGTVTSVDETSAGHRLVLSGGTALNCQANMPA